MKHQTLYLGIFLYLISIFRVSYGVDISLYTGQNFTGSYWSTKDATRCQNFGDGKGNPIRAGIWSLSTDTCVIISGYSNCQGSWSKKFLPGSHNFPSQWTIGSYRACNNAEGGPQLNVGITTYWTEGGDKFPTTLHRYRNVCTCFNIPDDVQKLVKWSIDNHANDMIVYSESNCLTSTYKARRIPAGISVESREMNQYTRAKSFGPDTNSDYFKNNCVPQALNVQQRQSEQLKDLSNKVASYDKKLSDLKRDQELNLEKRLELFRHSNKLN